MKIQGEENFLYVTLCRVQREPAFSHELLPVTENLFGIQITPIFMPVRNSNGNPKQSDSGIRRNESTQQRPRH